MTNLRPRRPVMTSLSFTRNSMSSHALTLTIEPRPSLLWVAVNRAFSSVKTRDLNWERCRGDSSNRGRSANWNMPGSGEQITLHAALLDLFIDPLRIFRQSAFYPCGILENGVAHPRWVARQRRIEPVLDLASNRIANL